MGHSRIGAFFCDFHFTVPVLVPRFSPGSIPPRSVPSRWSYCYCLCLPSLCAIFSVLFLIRTSARLPACCTRLLPHTLCLLPCARCFGELLWDAAFCSNFGEQLWGTTLGSNFAALQHHWRTVFEERQLWGVALSKATLGSSFRQQL